MRGVKKATENIDVSKLDKLGIIEYNVYERSWLKC